MDWYNTHQHDTTMYGLAALHIVFAIHALEKNKDHLLHVRAL